MTRRILCSLVALLFLQPAMAQRKYNRTTKDPLFIYMVKVHGGSFDLGSDDGAADRKPAHTVKLKDYYIGTYEVTQAQWKSIMGTNPSSYKCDDCPVTDISWSDAQEFIDKLNAKTGKHYRLPTEAEWEYAARGDSHETLVKQNQGVSRGGVNQFLNAHPDERMPDKEKTGKKYAGKRLPQDVAWYQWNAKDKEHRVGLKKPNEIGTYDMSGNVEEWCSDWYAGTYGSKDDIENPQGPGSGNAHVVRGGSWNSDASEIVITRRAAYLPGTKANTLGFRLAED